MLKKLINEKEIRKICKSLGKKITSDYKGSSPVFIGLLKGCLPFMSDLLKHIKLDAIIDYMWVSSYEGTESTNNLKITKDVSFPIKDRDVILVEDIVDTGLTISEVKKHLLKKNPKSIKVVSFLDKPIKRKVKVTVDYLGKVVPDEFIIGYGLDYNQRFRNLPYVITFSQSYKIKRN